ncbi:MAG: hypothetical protein IJC43_08420 [Clostridia bacterium]|nr:hypothetical protein [Clostridia bacterium]
MKKPALKIGLLLWLFGLLTAAAALFLHPPHAEFLWGLTGAGFSGGGLLLFLFLYFNRDDRAPLLDRHLQEIRITMEDERHIMLRDRASSLTFLLSLLVKAVLVIVFCLVAAFGMWTEVLRILVCCLCALFFSELLISLLLLHWLEKRL